MAFDAATQMAKLLDPYWRAETEESDKFSAPFVDWLEKRPGENANVIGQKVKVRIGYNESESGASFDGGNLAFGGNSSFENILVPYRTISAQGLLTKEAIDNDDGKSKYHPVVEEVRILMKRGMQNLNRAALMDDGSGKRAILSSAYAGGGDAAKIVCVPSSEFGNKGTQFLPVGKRIQVCDPSSYAVRTGSVTNGYVDIQTNTLSTGVLTVETAAGVAQAPTDGADGDLVVPEGMAGRGVHGIEYWNKISGSLFTLSLSSYPGLKSQHVSGASGSLMVLVEQMFAKLAHKVDEDIALGKGAEAKHTGFWSPTQRQRYRQEAIGLGIANIGASSIDTGYGHVEEINGYKMMCIGDHSNTRINFLRQSDWYRIQRGSAEKPFERYDINGQAVYNKYNSDGGETFGLGFALTGYFNVACKNTRDQAAIYDLPTSGLETGNA